MRTQRATKIILLIISALCLLLVLAIRHFDV